MNNPVWWSGTARRLGFAVVDLAKDPIATGSLTRSTTLKISYRIFNKIHYPKDKLTQTTSVSLGFQQFDDFLVARILSENQCGFPVIFVHQ
ncbi:hypothetical protein Pla52n_34390 [Stieleria varia]|uniref:Uncharacterized protein n=1 Tax=Stieleria varia TaxID=2528005 RepID=A0A5C6ASX7_9BACT|nr:hypothetical protein Pla52n_34390 [Stieleria varia]